MYLPDCLLAFLACRSARCGKPRPPEGPRAFAIDRFGFREKGSRASDSGFGVYLWRQGQEIRKDGTKYSIGPCQENNRKQVFRRFLRAVSQAKWAEDSAAQHAQLEAQLAKFLGPASTRSKQNEIEREKERYTWCWVRRQWVFGSRSVLQR